ncbi:MAG: succinyl-diaminopimelate desuccinylase [Actinomycetota bacterium]|nr:succinyl-diaminopimelate desuccinylase [Actinomycetota bacterium]
MAGREIAERLARRTLELVDIPSESRREAEIVRYVREALALDVELATEDVVFATTSRRELPLVLLAGHVDTVPSQGNLPGRLEEDAVVGLGASDMKGGIAVMLELAAWAEAEEPAFDLGFLFFTREELAAQESPLPDFLAGSKRAREAQLVIVLEPTDNAIHAGCLGNVNARVTFHGRSAHSARPWLGENAIHAAVRALALVAEAEPLAVEVDGLTFREIASVVSIEGGIAANVVPDRAVAEINYRYASTRTAAEAEQRLRDLVPAGELEVLSNSPPAPVVVDTPLARRLREAGRFEVHPKQAWTPVAQFAEHGLDAINLGPGATRYAHSRDERVEIAELVRTFTALQRFAADSV